MTSQTDLFGGAPAQSHDALGFLRQFACARQSAPWSPEEAIGAAAAAGISFQDQRAWGGVFQTAAREGVIARAGQFPASHQTSLSGPAGSARGGERLMSFVTTAIQEVMSLEKSESSRLPLVPFFGGVESNMKTKQKKQGGRHD